MSHWNFRVMRRTYDDGTVIDRIHEVYYDDEGEVNGWTETPVGAMYEHGVDEGGGIEVELQRMLDATQKPVLDWATGKEV